MRSALLSAALVLAACGPSPPPVLEVVARGLPWTAPAAAPRDPLSRHWSFAGGLGPWRTGAGTSATVEAGRTILTGQQAVELSGPEGGATDGELHHWLALRLRSGTARSLVVQWRGPGEGFSPLRQTTPIALDAGEGPQRHALPLATLRGVREARDAEDGVEAFRLRFLGEPGAEVRVALDEIALVSDYEDVENRGFATARLLRHGVARDGVALRLPGELHALLPDVGARRLRLALSALGAHEPVEVLLEDPDGGRPPRRVLCEPGGGWLEVALPLEATAPARLRLSARGVSGADGVLLVAEPLLLAPERRARPSIVLYVEDTLRADRLGSYGGARATDPALRRIAAQGVLFERAWASSNWTRASMSSLLTGLDPVAHGNHSHLRRVPDALATLAEALAEQGWLTASFVTNYHAGTWAGLHQGFDAQGDPRAFAAPQVSSTLTSAVLRDPLAAFLREHRDERVFVLAHSLDPHAPYEPPAELLARLDAAGAARAPDRIADAARWERLVPRYDAEILHNDGELARLLATLAAEGLDERTLLAFTSDHGEAFGEHGRWEHRQSLHEAELRVPLVLRWPGGLPGGRTLPDPISLQDLAPTLLGLCGLSAPADWEGRDLSALALGRGAARPAPLFAEARYDEPRAGAAREAAVIVWPHKLIVAADEAAQDVRALALFRLDEDPGERRDLRAEPAAAATLAALLEIARQRLARAPLAARADADAAPLDPALREWMQQMGYLR